MATTTERAPRPASAPFRRVLIVVQNMSFTYDTRVQNISRSLAKRGHSVHVLCPRYPGDPRAIVTEGVNVRFFRLPTSGGGLLGHFLEYAWSLLSVAWLARSKWRVAPFDAVHICNPPDFFFPLARVWRRRGAHVVYDQHDLVPELFEARYGNRRVLVNALKRSEQRSVACADHVLVTSHTARLRLVSMHGVDPGTVTVVPNAPDLARVPARQVSPPADLLTVGYLGNMNPQDGLELLLAAADFIHHTAGRRDVAFVCVGDGTSYKTLIRLRDRLRLTAVVRFVGRRPPEAAWRLLARCDICVQPDPANLFTNKTMMAKATEYMALAKPVVAFDLDETRRICGPAARYAKRGSPRALAEEIVALADDAELRAQMGALGRRRAERLFNWSASEAKLLRAYAKLSLEDIEDLPVQPLGHTQAGSREDGGSEIRQLRSRDRV